MHKIPTGDCIVKSTKQKTIEEKFNNLYKHEIIFAIMILGLYILAIFSPMWHNNNESAHSNMQQHIYRDMSDYRFDLDTALEARGWHKECMQNETYEKNEHVMDVDGLYSYEIKYNLTYCTKYQLVTDR